MNLNCLLFSEKERERESPKSSRDVGGRMVRCCWVNFHCRGVILIWKIKGDGLIALAVGAGGGGVCLEIFSLVYLFSFLSPSLGDGPILTEVLSQRAVKPKTTNQPNLVVNCMRTPVYSCCHVYSKVSDKKCIEE